MSRSQYLYDLQTIDSQLDAHHARIEAINRELADDQAVAAAQKQADQAQESFTTVHKKLLKAKAQVQDQRNKIAQSENVLYGGTVKNPKELADIQNEVAALKRYLDTLEERQLEAMLEVDSAQEVRDQTRGNLEETLAEAEVRNSTLSDEKHTHEEAVKTLQAQRQTQANRIEAADLQLYEQIRAQSGGIGAAKVQDRNCSACGSTLASAQYQQARSPSKITRCATCKRILYAE